MYRIFMLSANRARPIQGRAFCVLRHLTVKGVLSMRCTIAQDQAAQALRHLIRVMAPQNSVPLLTGIQLDATDDRLRLTATDLTHQVVVEIPGTVEEPGTMVIPGALLHDLVHRLPTATFTLTTDSDTGRALIRYGRHQAILHGFGDARLPDFPALMAPVATLAFPVGTLPVLSGQLLFACAKDPHRPILQGVQLTQAGDQLRAVSTDGARLSHTTWPLPAEAAFDTAVVVPAKTLQEAARLNVHQPVTLTVGHDLVQCQAPGLTFTSRVLAGQYPDTQRVLPTTFVAQVQIASAPLRQAVARLRIIAAKAGPAAALRLRIAADHLVLTTQVAEIGHGEEWLEATTDGEPLEILFNPQFLHEALASFTADTLHLAFAGTHAPLVMQAAANDTYRHVLLPLRSVSAP